MLWFLAREVLRLRGTLARTEPWDVMCDLFFYRDQEESAKEEAAVPAGDHPEQFEANAGQGAEGEWDQGTTIGPNVQLASGFAANEEWNPEGDTNWNKGAPTDSWANPPQTTWTAP